MTPLEELQHVLFGQLTHGNPTSDLECILDALTEAKAQGMEEAAKQCALGFVHPTAGANVLESRALGFEQLNIVEYWCRARAAAIRKGEG